MNRMLLALLVSAAVSPALAQETDSVPVFNMELDGKVTLAKVQVPKPPEPFFVYMCIREFEAPAIRCYFVNDKTAEVITMDMPLK